MEILVEHGARLFDHRARAQQQTKKEKTMNRNTEHFDWKIFEFSVEELQMILNSGDDTQDLTQVDCQKENNNHV
jgi:hypothetical protein